MTAPDLLPILSAGPHPDGPSSGACLNELVSYLAGEPWTDSPACAHPALRRLAAHVNDHTADSRRHLLAPLAPRLVDTAGTSEAIDVRLAGWLLVQAPQSAGRRRLLRDTRRWAPPPPSTTETSSAAQVHTAKAVDLLTPWIAVPSTTDEQRRELLEQAVGEWERLTGRTPPPMPQQRWQQCLDIVGAAPR